MSGNNERKPEMSKVNIAVCSFAVGFAAALAVLLSLPSPAQFRIDGLESENAGLRQRLVSTKADLSGQTRRLKSRDIKLASLEEQLHEKEEPIEVRVPEEPRSRETNYTQMPTRPAQSADNAGRVIGAIGQSLGMTGAAGRDSGPPARKGTALDAWVMAQEFVTDKLRSPSTAKFPWVASYDAAKYIDGKWHVKSYVDSQNGFGAMVRTEWAVVMTTSDGDNWKLVSFRAD